MTQHITARIDDDIAQIMRDMAKDDGRSISSWLNRHLKATICVATKELSKAKAPTKAVALIESKNVVLPEFLDTGLWNDFLAHRKKLRAPNTPRALNSLLKKLANFYHDGHNVNEIIQKSYDNGWKDVFEPKGGLNGGHSTELSKSSIEQDLRFDDF